MYSRKCFSGGSLVRVIAHSPPECLIIIDKCVQRAVGWRVSGPGTDGPLYADMKTLNIPTKLDSTLLSY